MVHEDDPRHQSLAFEAQLAADVQKTLDQRIPLISRIQPRVRAPGGVAVRGRIVIFSELVLGIRRRG